MNKTLSLLSEGLEPETRSAMARRVQALLANARFMMTSQPEKMKEAIDAGWSIERMEVIFSLNAFYLFVMGPLAASARPRSGTVWADIVITYGELYTFDAPRSRKIRNASNAFLDIAKKVPGGLETISANQVYDILSKLMKAVRAQDDE